MGKLSANNLRTSIKFKKKQKNLFMQWVSGMLHRKCKIDKRKCKNISNCRKLLKITISSTLKYRQIGETQINSLKFFS